LLWIFSEIIYFVSVPIVPIPPKYMLDLIFPCSVFFAKLVFSYAAHQTKKISNLQRNITAVILVMIIASYQIIGMFYFFLIMAPQRPAMETSRFLATQESSYNGIIAPAFTAIELKKKTFDVTGVTNLKYILETKVNFPVLYVLQERRTLDYLKDEKLRKKFNEVPMLKKLIEKVGVPIQRYGQFQIYRIAQKPQ
jgi:hypothetical protein